MGNISKRRRLKDLYVVGYMVHFNASAAGIFDDKGEHLAHFRKGSTPAPVPVEDETFKINEHDDLVWVQAPSPFQREQALREASVKRAKVVLAAKDDKDNDVYGLQAQTFLNEMSMDTLIEYVLTMSEGERYKQAQREVLAKSEWKDFSTLQDMMRQWEEAGQPDTEEWRPLIDRDIKFGTDVSNRADELRDGVREGYALQPREQLEKKALDRRLDIVGNQEFMIEYEKQMLYYSCRDPEVKHELYFDDVEDMLSYDEFVQGVIVEASKFLLQSPEEVRGLSRAAHGSESAVPPASPETSEASTPVASTA
jgi:hypothetical protein